MDLNETKETIKREHLLDVLQMFSPTPEPRHGKHIRCLNPGHDDPGPSMYVDLEGNRPHVNCFGCGANWDALDLIAQREGLAGYDGRVIDDELPKVIATGAEWFHLDYEPNRQPSPSTFQGPQGRPPTTNGAAPTTAAPAMMTQPPRYEAPADETQGFAEEYRERKQRMDLIRQARANIGHPALAEYLQRRGISMETARKMGLGYLDDYQPNEAKPYRHRAVIIPTGNSIIARNPDAAPGGKNKVWKRGPLEPFNLGALYQSETVHIVEGEIDALTVIEAGGHPIGIPSTSTVSKAVKAIMNELQTAGEPIKARNLVISLDRDKEGQTAAEKLLAELNAEEFQQAFQQATGDRPRVVKLEVSGDETDANELWLKDPDALRTNLKRITTPAEETAYRNSHSVAQQVTTFFENIQGKENTPPIPTGFRALDRVLGGGLYAGLYVLAGGTGMGKTAYALQIMEQIARGGHDVLYISMEMSTSELLARGASRITAEMRIHRSAHGDPQANKTAKTIREITNHELWSGYDAYELGSIREAFQRYAQYAGHVYIKEGIGDITADSIVSWVKEHQQNTGKAPVVIVDYVQILAPHDPRSSERQNIDHAVWTLKTLSRDYRTPVIALSSINRQSYGYDIGLGSFKESGALEFTCDVAIGLQLQGMADSDETGEKGRKSEEWLRERIHTNGLPRHVEAKIIKNRQGEPGDRIKYDYVAKYHLFLEEEPVYQRS